MSFIELRNVSVELPIYNVSARLLKKKFVRVATGGTVYQDSHHNIMLVRSLNNISVSIQSGDRIGLLGHNGAGKSTMLRLLAKIYEPTSGQIKITGHVSTMLDLLQGMEADATGHENIFIRGMLLGFKPKQIMKIITEIEEFSGLGDYLSMPVRTYSTGMLTRLAFAVSTSMKPEILLLDEVFNAGDVDFINKAELRMASLLNQSNIVVLATHSDDLVNRFCNKIMILEQGSIKFFGPVAEGLPLYFLKYAS